MNETDKSEKSANELRDIANMIAIISVRFMDTPIGNKLSKLTFEVSQVAKELAQ